MGQWICMCRVYGFQISLRASPVSWLKLKCLFMSRASSVTFPGQNLSSVVTTSLWSKSMWWFSPMACSAMVDLSGCNSLQCRLCSFSLVPKLFPSSFANVDRIAVLTWDCVDDSFLVAFFRYRFCLHKKGPDGGHSSGSRADVCSSQTPSNSFTHPFDVGNCDGPNRFVRCGRLILSLLFVEGPVHKAGRVTILFGKYLPQVLLFLLEVCR